MYFLFFLFSIDDLGHLLPVISTQSTYVGLEAKAEQRSLTAAEKRKQRY